MNSYFIQAGREGVHWDYFKKKSIVAVDYKEICDFDLTGMTREEIKEGIKENRKQYEKKIGKPSNPIGELTNIAQIKAGDLIAVTVGRSSVKEFAIATSDYYFAPDKNANEDNAHRVDVEYLGFGTDKIYSDSPKGIFRDASNKILNYLGKQEKYFIITQNPDSRYDDVEGEQYQYDSHKQNSKRFVEGSNFIVQSKINEVNQFVGYGKVGTIVQSKDTTKEGKSITKFVAKYSDYTPFQEPKIRTDEIHQKMKDQKSYGGRAPAILPIDQSLYAEIIGEDLIENVQTYDTLPPSDYSKILKDDLNLLFYGPPGTGKTYLANNLAEEFISINVTDFDKVIPEVRYQPDFVDSMSDDEYKEFVINSIKKESEKRKFTFTEINTYGQYSIEKNGQQFHLDFHYSASATQDPDDSYVGISQANIDFFNQVPIENRFIVIVNHSHKNFVVLPYSIEQNHAKFSDSSAGNWDPSGKNAHSFHVEIKKDECKFKGSNYDCKKFLRNVGMIFGQFIRRVTFHPSYSYEEFVEGIRPNLDSDQISYKLEHGIFKEICRQAEFDDKNRYVLLIDEINRGNIPKIFGELITLIEDEKREVYSLNLTYSKELFTVPKNLYIIGTMNTADQSISHLDTALRRRFSHEELMPNGDLIDNTIDHNGKKINLKDVLEKINAKIRKDAGRERQIGHSYFMENDEAISEIVLLRDRFKSKIIPLIQDYFYEDMNKVHKILGEDFIDKTEETVKEKTLDDLDAFVDAVNAI